MREYSTCLQNLMSMKLGEKVIENFKVQNILLLLKIENILSANKQAGLCLNS